MEGTGERPRGNINNDPRVTYASCLFLSGAGPSFSKQVKNLVAQVVNHNNQSYFLTKVRQFIKQGCFIEILTEVWPNHAVFLLISRVLIQSYVTSQNLKQYRICINLVFSLLFLTSQINSEFSRIVHSLPDSFEASNESAFFCYRPCMLHLRDIFDGEYTTPSILRCNMICF